MVVFYRKTEDDVDVDDDVIGDASDVGGGGDMIYISSVGKNDDGGDGDDNVDDNYDGGDGDGGVDIVYKIPPRKLVCANAV